MSEDAPKKRGFTIIDRRGLEEEPAPAQPTAQAAPPPPPPPAAPAPPPPPVAEEPLDEDYPPGQPGQEGQEGAPDLSCSNFLKVICDELAVRAYIHLGLMANPVTNLITTNPREARLAIDVLGDLQRHLRPFLAQQEFLHLEDRLNQMRMAYVQSTGGV